MSRKYFCPHCGNQVLGHDDKSLAFTNAWEIYCPVCRNKSDIRWGNLLRLLFVFMVMPLLLLVSVWLSYFLEQWLGRYALAVAMISMFYGGRWTISIFVHFLRLEKIS